jgi:hypothetical protein
MAMPEFRIVRQDDSCPDTNTCEKILQFDDAPLGTRHVIFKMETDVARLAAARDLIGPGEALGYTTLIPDVT